MQSQPQAEYDRYLVESPCDLCQRTATWTVRYRFAGESFHEINACNRHRRQAEERAKRRRGDDVPPLEFQRVARTAF
jgi:hypothetical protein